MKLILIAIFLSSTPIFTQLGPTNTEALIKVTVTDNKGEAQAGEIIQFTSTSTGKAQKHTSNEEGKFEILLPKGEEYKIEILTFNSTDEEPSLLQIPDVEGQIVLNYNISTSVVNTFLLDIQFNTNEASLQPSSHQALDEFFKILDSKKDMKVEIGGHTDNVGSAQANQILSEKRANAVKEYLVKKGIDANRIKAKGYGQTTPIATNETPEGRQQNRRTEVKVIQE